MYTRWLMRQKYLLMALLCWSYAIVHGESSQATHLPSSYGKTHFIVGCPADTFDAKKAPEPEAVCPDDEHGLICQGRIKRVLFSPDDNVQKVLLSLIEKEKKSISLAAFSFTDGDIAKALLDARDRGVKIELVVDPSCMYDRFGKISTLQENGVVVYVYDPNYKKNQSKGFLNSIMHHKFIVFGNNLSGKSLVWTGSFNFTKSAHKHNQENVLLLDDVSCVQKYAKQFEVLKRRSHKPKNTQTNKPGL